MPLSPSVSLAFRAALVAGTLTAAAGCSRSSNGPGESSERPPAATEFTLSDFERFPDDAQFDATSAGFATDGGPKGYVYSRMPIAEGTLSYEYRFPASPDGAHVEDPNTGLLLFVTPPHRKWPACIEVQGKQSEAGRVKSNGGFAEPEVLHDEAALAAAPKPPGEWNTVSVDIAADGLAVRLNDQLTASAVLGGVTPAPFGLQTEGNAVEFRGVRFQPAFAE